MQTTLLVLRVFPPPATGPNVLPRLDGPGTRGATDAGEAQIMEPVVGDMILFDVVPDLLVGPVDQGINLGDTAMRHVNF